MCLLKFTSNIKEKKMNSFTENNENKTICSACGGRCCNTMGCHYSPDDIGEIRVDNIMSHLNTGNVSIDWWEGDVFEKDRSHVYYLRARHKHAGILDGSWGGRCRLLTEEGCSLPFEKRPKGGRAVIPAEDFKCKGLYSKRQCCEDWYKYQDVLDNIVKNLDKNNK
jgi:hypothetical protein